MEREPVAWLYEVATIWAPPGEFSGWQTRVSLLKPVVPIGCMRNLRPLFLDDDATKKPAPAGIAATGA